MEPHVKHTRLVFCLLACLASVATAQYPANASQEPLEDLARAEAKWRASKTDAYEFRFQHACNGLIAPPRPGEPLGVLFRVSGGESKFLGPAGAAARVPRDLVQYSTVERLFAFIRKVWAGRPSDPLDPPTRGLTPMFQMDVQYDQARGYPTRVCVDPSSITSDDEFGFVITDFTLLSDVGEKPEP